MSKVPLVTFDAFIFVRLLPSRTGSCAFEFSWTRSLAPLNIFPCTVTEPSSPMATFPVVPPPVRPEPTVTPVIVPPEDDEIVIVFVAWLLDTLIFPPPTTLIFPPLLTIPLMLETILAWIALRGIDWPSCVTLLGSWAVFNVPLVMLLA